ncbi:MAG: hypothetical protein ABIC96_04205 [Patescibacteria group bacterium]
MDSSAAIENTKPFPCPDVAYFPVNPALAGNKELASQVFRIVGEKSKALVLTGYASGSIPDQLNPFITELKQKGIPTFVLSSNFGEDSGSHRTNYDVHHKTAEAGTILLQKPNINRGEEVIKAVQELINEGKTGDELIKAVVKKYGTAA